jgi:hypothetical protein
MYAIPEGISFEQAATVPVALQTMHDAISTNGTLAAGQTVLGKPEMENGKGEKCEEGDLNPKRKPK